jgi:hypothetical protein
MPQIDDDSLDGFKEDFESALQSEGIRCGPVSVTLVDASGHDLITVSAHLLEDAMMPIQREWQRTVLSATAYQWSKVSDRPVIWAESTYLVDREQSFFTPVPDEYGEQVSIRFGWDIDIETLTPTYADVRDRESVHYCSVLPSVQLTGFVKCFLRTLKARNILPAIV